LTCLHTVLLQADVLGVVMADIGCTALHHAYCAHVTMDSCHSVTVQLRLDTPLAWPCVSITPHTTVTGIHQLHISHIIWHDICSCGV